MNDLEEIIKSNVTFHSVASTGFHILRCPMCGDSRKIRAGFIFTPDSIGYSCFRGKCDANAVYKYGEPMSRKFKSLMDALDISIPLDLLFLKKNNKIQELLDDTKYEPHQYKKMNIPDHFKKIDKDKHKKYIKWLKDRCIKCYDKFYIGSEGELKNKLIILFYFNNNVIGWQGVDIYSGKYLKCSGASSDLMFINNKKGRIIDNPIIVEGVFDALSIPDAIAVLYNTVSRKQAYFLRKCKPILLPDKKDSNFLYLMNLYGWRMSIPEWNEKDVNEALQKYGLFIVSKMIYDGIEKNNIRVGVKYKLWKKN